MPSYLIVVVAVLSLLLTVIIVFQVIPFVIQFRLNRTWRYYSHADEDVFTLHNNLFIADLHCDSLIWNRNLLRRHNYGHVDIPRLVSGNVALQIFGVPTRLPWWSNFDHNPSTSDIITALVILQAWPLKTWRSPLQRALYVASKLDKLVSQSKGKLIIVKSVSDLNKLLILRNSDPTITGAVLSIEGAHALENDINNLEVLYDAGFRMIGLSHFFDNEVGGSAHGINRIGLTDFGRELIARMERKNMLIDLAHASTRLIEDVCDIYTGPLVVSHTGVRGICDNQRNLNDHQILQIADSNGVVGIAMFEAALCGRDIEDIVRTISYTVNLGGIDCVALGSDFDGSLATPIDSSGMVYITESLIKHGFSNDDIAKIMGENVLRVLRQVLPDN